MQVQKVREILGKTGNLDFIEQFYQIGLKVLGLEMSELNKMFEAYVKKKEGEIKKYNSLIFEKVKDKQLAEQLIFLFTMQLPYANYELVFKIKENNLNMMIDNILSPTNGKLKYYFQAVMLLTDVVGVSEYQAKYLITNYQKPELREGEKEYIASKLYKHPSVYSRIDSLLSEYANQLEPHIPLLTSLKEDKNLIESVLE